jgi:4'-phosphopantetheinyl transferase
MNIDVRTKRLEAPASEVASLFEVLSADERERALRFVTETLTSRYVIARATLRILLGERLACDPAALRFDYSTNGKPSLRGLELSFNVSHSGALAVYAFAEGEVPLGIDVEEVRPLSEMHDLARRFFAPEEWRALAEVDVPLQTAAFFHCWTRKEAYLKALGDGLMAPLDQFAVTLRPGEEAAFVHIGGDVAAGAAWRIRHFVPEPGYVAAAVWREP